MNIKTYFDKNNTIVSNQNVNTGLNPITQLFYGGLNGQYSRFLFHFDESKLVSLYTGGTFTDLSKLKHTLKMTNTNMFNNEHFSDTVGGYSRATSFDLILFKISQPWDNGVGYDYQVSNYIFGESPYSVNPSNWIWAQTGFAWTGGTGVYSGSPSAITVTTQHFDLGNENLVMDVTDYVNGILTGDTNYGLGIAYTTGFEQTLTSEPLFVGFFNRNTQTFYEPYIETTYSNHIKDDRNDFFLDKPNKLYLYVNLGGNPINLDTLPTVNVYDYNGDLFSSFTQTAVTNVTLGVYSIDINIPTTADNIDTMYNDVWSGITINGVNRPAITLNIPVKDSMGYYNIGSDDMLPKQIAVSVSGIQNQEKVKKGDIRKVIVSARIPYTVNQSQKIDGLQYRLYVKEGNAELTVIDFEQIEMANNYYYFLLDTASLIPNMYYLDVVATSSNEVTTLKNVLQFEIVNQVELRKGQ